MADMGWIEVTWRTTLPFSLLNDSGMQHLLPRYEKLTGRSRPNRTGSRVTGFEVGDHVAASFVPACGSMRWST